LRLLELTGDQLAIETLSSRRIDLDGRAAVCRACENLQWGR
jgi:hypothetical protein